MKILCYPCHKTRDYCISILKDDEEQESDIEIIYSSGESDGSDFIVIKGSDEFNEMDKHERDKHVFVMWQKLSKKLRGAIYIKQVFQKLNKKLFLEGTTKVFMEE